ncbi:MAG TPA: bifunctional hydroxymethylpyrimidine kinase/phosphomethylpyrimidine kinase [Rhodospirillaceae bacterium]|jgi:hydroxymethylpyrimidine/phosphomethylpyrimidine kinase|nr:bifunctional hydroxymethylpyrimidine kinase/phosphomethylpyrimidine kinase [Alphaproteobacteria bacterium]HBH26671.1 bifunctional hydroxymethylpyrimidine kinase/phosphomethylpyrimidine kinase [Rhodospirillaceae bacterium]
MIPNVLTIAGSDPSGGAGIQADLKTFAALGTYGMAALTALTAQNTRGVRAVHGLPADFVAAQVQAVLDDVRVDAAKIGMAGEAAVIEALAGLLASRKPPHLVVDPVMVAASGDMLLSKESAQALRTHLVPLADVLTPNLPEAAAFLGCALPQEEAAKALLDLGPRAVLLKGGHAQGAESTDVYVDRSGAVLHLSAPRIDTRATHGTGCTLAAALAAYLALGADGPGAARAAKAFVTGAITGADALEVGSGHGPVNHLWQTA